MITNRNDIQEYENMNKIYIPNQYISNSYKYYFNGDNYIRIITNNNCYQNYNTQYCDCMDYNYKVNVITNTYQCNSNQTNYQISRSLITNDINDSMIIREKYTQEKGINAFIIGLGIVILLIVITRNKT